nr:CobW family GTP-binding protein [Paenibacillus sp. SGZ-1009]
MEMTVPIYILSGFLGSGKTTLLQHMLENWKADGKTPAVVMNEIGDVNLDGMMLDGDVAMAELLSGCICCSNRADLGMELYNLIQSQQPDMIVIEASGVANPVEILDAVTEISLYHRMELRNLITVVDAKHLWKLYEQQQGKTYRLMQEQIRAASILIVNKSDLVQPEQLEQVQNIARRWNPYAPLYMTVRCELERALYEQTHPSLAAESSPQYAADITANPTATPLATTAAHAEEHTQTGDHNNDAHNDHHHGDVTNYEHYSCQLFDAQNKANTAEFTVAEASDTAAPQAHTHHDTHEHDHHPSLHHSHAHVMVYTHYFNAPIDSAAFERLIADLPSEVYRAKGILTFSDTNSRFLFQYAYKQSDFMKITPQKQVPDVAVFIGEHFDKRHIQAQLLLLEQATSC